jgi:hypothetical protein
MSVLFQYGEVSADKSKFFSLRLKLSDELDHLDETIIVRQSIPHTDNAVSKKQFISISINPKLN